MKKAFFLLVTVMVLMPFTVYGVGGQQPGVVTTKPQISITLLDRGRVNPAEGTYSDNRWTRWVNETSPVNVTWVPVLRTEAVQRINTLFAAGTAPDLVYEYGKTFMDNLYGQGVIQPVGDYIERYSTAYKNYLRTVPDVTPHLYADDGKMYGMSSRRTIEDLYIFGWWIRQDWVQKFNMRTPAHIDDLITFMRRVRDEDPDGNGIKDTWGFVFRTSYYQDVRSIFGAPYNDFLVENGRFVDWTTTPGYRDYLAFWTQLYQEGLIDPEFVTDTQSTRQEQLRDTGMAGVYFGVRPSNGDSFFAKTLRRNIPTARIVPFDPPATKYGKFDMKMEDPALYMVCMNRNARNPQAIMQFADWMITDGWMPLRYGFEGTHYRLENGVPIRINLDITNVQMGYTGDMAILSQLNQAPHWYSTDVNRDDPLSIEYGQVQADWFAARLNDKPLKYIPYAPSSENIIRYNTEMSAQVISALEIAIITGRVSLDAGLQQITNAKNAAGWAAANADKQAWYDKNKHLF